MNQRTIKILTLGLVFLCQPITFAALVVEDAANYFRMKVYASRDSIVLEKKGSVAYIKTLDFKIFNELVKDLEKLSLSKKIFKGYEVLSPSEKENVTSIKLNFVNDQVELFSFYKNREKALIIDFWKEVDSIDQKVSSIDKKGKKATAAKSKFVKKPVGLVKSKSVAKKKVVSKKKIKPVQNLKYRDYRYGAAFTWDYETLSPKISQTVRIDRKTAEYFYEIKNRVKADEDEAEAHLQLTINLYRKKKWGLMYKSMKLFQKKYKEERSQDLIEFMKANAILHDSMIKGNTEPVKTALAMYQNIMNRSSEYELRRAVYKYLLQYYLEKKEFVQSLRLSKKYYVDSKESFDYEESNYAAEIILHSLARLNQIDKVRALLNEKTIKKLLPKQMMYAYEVYTLANRGESKEVIKFYEKHEKNLVKPVHEVILYNVAESYFRNAEYGKAIKLYDEYISQYSYLNNSSHARLRIALSYEILERDTDKVIELYKNAINRSQDKKVSYEARIRYVALRSVRKKKLDQSDIELRVFLNEKRDVASDSNIEQLKWLVRLRTFIVDRKFKEALTYLNAIPLKTLTPTHKRVFEADGAEIVYGLINEFFKNGDYSEVIRTWDIYADRYLNKVAQDAEMNFIVGKSYLLMGLYDGFDKIYENFSKSITSVTRTFPIWYDRSAGIDIKTMLSELQLVRNIKLKNWNVAKRQLLKLEKNKAYTKTLLYKGIINYNLKKFVEAEKAFEKYLSSDEVMDNGNSFESLSEAAEVFQAYSDSIYEQSKPEKFRKVASALLKDTRNKTSKNKYFNSVRERIAYLEIETVAASKTAEDNLILEVKIKNFKEDYPKSSYSGRVEFLYGSSLVINKKPKEARKVFNGILEMPEASEHMKNMVRSELSLMRIKERTL